MIKNKFPVFTHSFMTIFFVFMIIFSINSNAEDAPWSSREVCENSLNRYLSIGDSWYPQCASANRHSALAIDFYTRKFTESFGRSMFNTLLAIKTREQSMCAISLARQYDVFTATLLYETCF